MMAIESTSPDESQKPGQSEEWWERRPAKPALQALEYNQQEVLEELLEGFSTRRDVIEWYQRAGVRTFGYLSNEWEPSQLVQDLEMVRSMLSDRVHDRAQRRRYAQAVVLPACNRAYRDLRDRSGEYVEDDDQDAKDLDPREQKWLAMRPAHSELDKRQQRALEDLWGGFADLDAVLKWLLDLNQPTHGEIDRELARELLSDDHLAEMLVTDEQSESVAGVRNRFAITVLLPAFVAGARDLSAGESPNKQSGGLSVPHG